MNCSQGLGLEQGVTSYPPDPHYLSFPLVETHGTSGQCVSFSFIDAGSILLPVYFSSSVHACMLLLRSPKIMSYSIFCKVMSMQQEFAIVNWYKSQALMYEV